MSKRIIASDFGGLLELRLSFQIVGRYSTSKKWYFFKSVYIVTDWVSPLASGNNVYPDEWVYETLNEAFFKFQKLRLR